MPADRLNELESCVVSRLGTRVRDFRIVLTDDGVCLRGHAETYYVKQLAQHVVMEATRTPILANEIEGA